MTPGEKKIFLALLAIILILVAAVAILVKKADANKDDLTAYQQAMSNKFDTIRNKIGQQTASVPVSVFSDLKSMKAAIGQLNASGANIESKVDGNTQSLTLLAKRIGTTIQGTTKIVGQDTAKVNAIAGRPDTIKTYPIYGIDTINKFYSLKGEVGFKHYKLTPVFFDSTEFKGELVSHGLFKAGELTAFSLNKNPFASTTQLKSLVVKKTAAPVWKYVWIAIGAAGGFYLRTHYK